MGVDVIGVADRVLVTKPNTAGQSVIGIAAWTSSSDSAVWRQITASLPADYVLTQAAFASNVGTLTGVTSIEIAIGGAGSEVVLTTVYFYSAGTSGVSNLPVLQCIAAGQRIAARSQNASTASNGTSCNLYLLGVPYANVEGK